MKRKTLSSKSMSLKTLAVAAMLAMGGVCAFAAPAFAADAPAAASTTPSAHVPLLWKVSDGDNSLYLLGSIHLLKKSDHPLSTDIDAVFREARSVMFEIDIEQGMSADKVQLMQQRATFDNGRTLKDVLPAGTMTKLEALLARSGTPLSQVETQEPWALNLQFTLGVMMALGFDPQSGVDIHLTRKAREAGKPVLTLETFESQLAMLESQPEAEQLRGLDRFLTDPKQTVAAALKMHADWKAGNVDAMDRELRQKMADETPVSYRLMNTDRNDAWIPKLQARLDGHGKGDDTLAVVGAMHLLGKDGVVEKLRAKGYRVERVCSACDSAGN